MSDQNQHTRYIFIINPSAGRSKTDMLEKEIHAIWSTSGEEYRIYKTTGHGDGESYVRACCEKHLDSDESSKDNCGILRFYACGGDGTLHEVVNGAYGFDFAEVGSIPTGSGNDFVRNFPDADFNDLIAQLKGTAMPCDLIRCQSVPSSDDDPITTRHCINMVNIGFDCAVVDTTDRIKRLPLISGSLAYLWSIALNLIEKRSYQLRVEFPNGFVYDGSLLLLSIANGCFCGGGIKGLPLAKIDDGRMDVSLVKTVQRRTFVRLFPKYQQGTHLDDPRLSDIVRYTQETSLDVSASTGSFKFCVDGEVCDARSIRFTILPKTIKFVIPSVE